MLECRDTGMKPSDLIWVDSDKSVDPTRNKIPSTLCARENQKKKQGMIQRVRPACQLFSTMPPVEAGKVLVFMDTTTSAEHISKEQPRDSFTSDVPQRIVKSVAETKLELKTVLTSGNLTV